MKYSLIGVDINAPVPMSITTPMKKNINPADDDNHSPMTISQDEHHH